MLLVGGVKKAVPGMKSKERTNRISIVWARQEYEEQEEDEDEDEDEYEYDKVMDTSPVPPRCDE